MADDQAFVLDWGMARLGPSWTDLVLLAAQQPSAAQAQAALEAWVPGEAQDSVTSFVVAFGGSQAYNAQQPPAPSLPAIPAFCADDAARLLAIAKLRLGL